MKINWSIGNPFARAFKLRSYHLKKGVESG